jgi:hypothetical protein
MVLVYGCAIYCKNELESISVRTTLLKSTWKIDRYSEELIPLDRGGTVEVLPVDLNERTRLLPLFPLLVQRPTGEFSGRMFFHCKPYPSQIEVRQMTLRSEDGSWNHSILLESPVAVGSPARVGGPHDFCAILDIPLFSLPDSVDVVNLVVRYAILSAPEVPRGEVIFRLHRHRSFEPGFIMD